jgi:mannose-6-phosphate isomerase-like protein (cupin superfamily)
MKIGIIGTGNMARSLGILWAEQGHEVFFGSRNAEKGHSVARQIIMKRIIVTLVILLFTTAIAICPIPKAIAVPLLTEQSIAIFHTDENNTVTMDKEVFTYKTYSNKDTSKTRSVVEVSQPAQYEGLLLRKHILQVPEEIYVMKGDFEFVFSQTDRKTKVTEGDIVSVPSGLPFGFRHIGTGEGKVLVVSESNSLPKMLAQLETSDVNKTATLDFNQISAIAKKYGIEFLN